MEMEWTLPFLARVWFEKSELQHNVLVRNIRRLERKEGTAVRQDQCTPCTKQ
ncbi:ribosomal protein L14 [Fontibacillus solani]|uniref:Ribosomal protein L14 n=1 Tax=Fontibacillus solani TaxID=1572857 RepID=A0A7W3SUJ8_9BACL|nr:hypothetical protein [Fontibacillus solani]MBA9086536.1 ribosomal protein L14 [Fontibacillus solani]